MKPKHYILVLSLASAILPLAVQGALLLKKGEGGTGGGPTASLRRAVMPPVMIETAPEMLYLLFTRDLGEVTIELRGVTGRPLISQPVNTSIQTNESLMLPAGAYLLTITAAEDETVLLETTIVIP